MFYKTALLGAVAFGFTVSATAQTASIEETKLDTIIVNGSRLDQTMTEIGSSVSVITRDDLEELGVDFALDAIATAPGVTVNQNGAFGGNASVRIRGASNDQTLVLIDGVPVNDPTGTGGGYNFAYLDTDTIERIEVLKGPQSTLWGSDAIGGVVSITTKRPTEGLSGTVFGEYGSFNTLRGGASISNANEIGDFRLAATGLTTDGISKADEANGNSEDDGYDSQTVSAKGGLNLPASVRLETSLMWSDAESEYDSYAFGAQGSVADGDEVTNSETLSGNITLKAPLFDGRLENLVQIGYADIERENTSNGVQSYFTEGDRVLFRYQGTFAINDTNTLAFGTEREETSANEQESSIDSLFALYEFKPVDSLTLTGGIRVDDHETFGSETTGRVAAAWTATDQLTFKASWGQGFKAPSIFQSTYICTFCGLTAPNTNLKAETSEAYDIGVQWQSADERIVLGATLFDQETENMIDFSYTAGYDNIALVDSQGGELTGAYAINNWLGIAASYTFIDSDDGNGNALARLPESTGNISASFDPDGPFSGAVLVRYNGEETNTDGSELDSWTRVDLTGSYDLNDTVEIYGRIENLLDEEYQQILGYGTPGLSGSVGVRLRY
ncbi:MULTISPECIES: TonB-dependent receptor plug domain-containing protein [unclassified Hyphomonas]|uniref:TonB-dependent receptor plug domain-containing protein n=1 Tax=unclassified Hyphomonas TaxID=2630699 RepID=UPI000C4668C4|nr:MULTISPECIES: TonB-dependent receptor [unclassified Hyphomonas]MAN90336.1 TonB-dependent receptor [Hyphomonadaceae bacterium]MAA83042.1 TonB-dependent receptor [Hyphomonas sp.]MAL46507.1 TonB-dependent receptor [Hyphomonas sp.]MAN91116.1 TonB-dependent receptor [Hyphomonadaceae bacterium]HAO34567.1 TonB-dependent receptor [Hyphomonas sp.]|tara:strand:- start:3129 stop:4976 length:1848 start_codon:yes stop_codon:yes gene_type:complete